MTLVPPDLTEREAELYSALVDAEKRILDLEEKVVEMNEKSKKEDRAVLLRRLAGARKIVSYAAGIREGCCGKAEGWNACIHDQSRKVLETL